MQGISVKQAAQLMGKSEQFVRIGLQRGLLPIGQAIKMSSMWTYYISPKLFEEFTGAKIQDWILSLVIRYRLNLQKRFEQMLMFCEQVYFNNKKEDL